MKKADAVRPDPEQFKPLYDLPGYMVRRIQQRTSLAFHTEVDRFGITSPQFAILRIVELAPGLEQREIAEAAGYDAPTTGGILRRLAEAGLIQMNKGHRSRRGHAVTLTPAGARRLKQIGPGMERVQNRILELLSPTERTTLLRLLSKACDITNSFNPK